MADTDLPDFAAAHSHVFLGEGHERNERRTWLVIWLCGFMMAVEIIGGSLFGSLALIADGLHMSTHAGALLLAALAYTYARKHANDPRFAFGTGKVGDLAGFTSAIILAMIALLIGYEAVSRLLNPVAIDFAEAIPIAMLGLLVNGGSAWLLGGGSGHDDGHGHHHGHAHPVSDDAVRHGHGADVRRIDLGQGALALQIFEDGVPPRFRARYEEGSILSANDLTVTTIRDDGSRHDFVFEQRGNFLESRDVVPEPHAFRAHVQVRGGARDGQDHVLFFSEEDDGHRIHDERHARDHNMRAAFVHVMADAAVSILVIAGLVLGRVFGWVWMDPAVGMVGALVIASWAYGLIRDTAAILLDRTPDPRMAESVRQAIEGDGDRLIDLHLWRLGPGHLGAIVSIRTDKERGPVYYRRQLSRFRTFSHVTVEVHPSDR